MPEFLLDLHRCTWYELSTEITLTVSVLCKMCSKASELQVNDVGPNDPLVVTYCKLLFSSQFNL